MCRSKTVHECDLFIGVAKNEGEDEVSVKLVIEYSHAVKVKLDTYKIRERDPQDIKPTNAILTAFGGNKIDVLCRCQLKCRYKIIVFVLDCYIVNVCLCTRSFSLKTFQKLSLIKVVMNDSEFWGW